ncbi:MAG: hypothetical protein RLO12_15155 [Fulvivirga sp.]
MIRIQNSSDFKFQNVYVNTGFEGHNYEDILPTNYSDYVGFESAYRYAYIQLEIDNRLYIIQPIDYVGEKELKPGKYSYVIGVDTARMSVYGTTNPDDYIGGDELNNKQLDSLASINYDALTLKLKSE